MELHCIFYRLVGVKCEHSTSKDVILFSRFFIDRNIIKRHILPLLQLPPSSRWLWQVCEQSTCRDDILFFRFSMNRNIIKCHILPYCNFHHHQADFDKYACLHSLTLFSLCVNKLSTNIVRKEKESHSARDWEIMDEPPHELGPKMALSIHLLYITQDECVCCPI